MKKVTILAAAFMIVAGASFVATFAQGEGAASTESAPHKIGLIDMAHIFKEYAKFKNLREELKVEIGKSDSQAKEMAESLKKLQAEMQTFQAGSPEFIEAESKLAKESSNFEAFRKLAQRDFLRKESQIYKTIYLEVTDMVEKYATHYHYTLVMRFNREEVGSAEDPPEVIKSMNRQVVYYRPQDDITEPILKFLNQRYSPGETAVPRPKSTGIPKGTSKN
ncbi:MAG: OmpH family outer membrane protein [Planctomycetaceae bacterium]